MDDTDVAARLTEALEEHRQRHAPVRASWGDGTKFAGCTCGWELAWPASTQWQPAPPPVETFEHHRAAALLPLVREIADQRAAEIVQTAADGSRPHDHVIAEWLDRRAAALRGEAGALDGPDTTP
jgi:hypothetical protein